MTFYYRLRTITAVLSLLVSLCAYAQKSKNGLAQPAVYQQKMQSSALLCMENKGQIVDAKGNLQQDILYTANSGGAKIYLTATGIHYQFSKTDYPKGYDPFSKEPTKNPEAEAALRKQIKISTHRFTVELQGANTATVVTKQGQSDYYENYYLPQCPNGITGVHGYEKITFKNMYPNIDWVVYSKGGFMEYDFLVHPGGNPASIKLKIKDADNVSITPQGELLMKTSLGEVREKAPVSYADGRMVPSRFKQNADGTIGFAVQAQPGKELRIDPSIVWSTYYGGDWLETGGYCTTDNDNNVYLTGGTGSTTRIASGGGFQTTINGNKYDAFIAKFDNNGNRIWATYYGGTDDEQVGSCTTDGNGNIYMAGVTSSTDVIAAGGFQNNYAGNRDAFISKFSTNGLRIWSTYCGGSFYEADIKCCSDSNNNVYLSGTTASPAGIASGGFQNSLVTNGLSGVDAFLIKINSDGNRLWGTYYGGEALERAGSCATDATGSVYLSGKTLSNTGIASGGFQNIHSNGVFNEDAFLVKFDVNGNRLWATYYGGILNDWGRACTTDKFGNVFLAGETWSTNDIAYDGFQMSKSGDLDGFVAKFNSAGNRLWSSYYGGTDREVILDCRTDKFGFVYITGLTESNNNISFNGFQNNIRGLDDAFVAKINNCGTLIWSSYFGGDADDLGLACTVDFLGDVFISGYTSSTTGIALSGHQNQLDTLTHLDCYLAKIDANFNSPVVSAPVITTNRDTICKGATPTLTVTSNSLNGSFFWQWYKDSCGGTPVGNGTSITVTPNINTTYYVRAEGGCILNNACASKTIYVLQDSIAGAIIASPATICPGDTTIIKFVGNGAVANTYTWNWSSGNVINGSSAGPYKVRFDTSGTVTAVVSNGICSILFTAQSFTVQPKPVNVFSLNKSVGCSPLTISFNNTSPVAISNKWSFGNGAFSTDAIPQPQVYTTGNYIVSLQVSNGMCNSTITKPLRVLDNPIANFTVNPPINTSVPLRKANFQFSNTSVNSNRYTWQFGDGNASAVTSPLHLYHSMGTYTVSLVAYNNIGCADTLILGPLIVVADSLLKIPNAFSPNGDGINDKWMITTLQQSANCRVTVYNRWGQAVFTSTGYSKAWDGSYNSKPLPVDTYYYTITVGNKSYSGSVLLLR